MVMAFVIAAIAMLIAMIPAGVVLCRGRPHGGRGRLRVHHLGVVMVLALLAQGFQRSA